MSEDGRDPTPPPDVATDSSTNTEREALRKEIISQRRDMEPLMVTPTDEMVIDGRGSKSTNSSDRRLPTGPLTTTKSSRSSISRD